MLALASRNGSTYGVRGCHGVTLQSSANNVSKSIALRAFIVGPGRPPESGEGKPVQPVIAELRDFASPVCKLHQVAVAVVAVRLAHSPEKVP